MLALLMLLLFILQRCSTQSIYYVTPTPATPCPGRPCLTLAEYVDRAEQYFISNTAFKFLPGNHTLEQSISVENVTSLTLQGNTSYLPHTSKIICKQPASMNFNNVSNMQFDSLEFISCGDGIGGKNAAVYVGSTANFEILRCNFSNSVLPRGGRILELKESSIQLIGTAFFNNNINAGYVVCINNSTVNITGASFVNNTAHGEGASVIYVEGSILNFNGSRFFNNRAVYEISVNFINDYTIAAHFSNWLTVGKTMNFIADALSISDGNGIVVLRSSVYFFRNCFINYHGGSSIHVRQSVVTFVKNSFRNNTNGFDLSSVGGGVQLLESNATFTGNKFIANFAQSGGAVSVFLDSCANFSGNSFVDNTVGGEGGGVSIFQSVVNFTEDRFTGNSATRGGSIVSVYSTIIINHCNISSNSANESGGAIFAEGNLVLANGRGDCSVGIYNSSRIESNSAQYGGAVYLLNCDLQISQNVVCKDNTADYGGCLSLISSAAIISTDSNIEFNNANLYGGGVYAARSDLYFEQNISFSGNSAIAGGGLLLTANSYLYLSPFTRIYFLSNSVNKTGGAIGIMQGNPVVNCDIESAIPVSDCFFQIRESLCDKSTGKLLFDDNSATVGGGDIYGGSIDHCRVCEDSSAGNRIFNQITSGKTATIEVSSDPLHLYTCNTSHNTPIGVYPGGILQLFVTAKGQKNGSVSAIVRADEAQGNIKISELQTTQEIKQICTAIRYTIFGLPGRDKEVFTMYTEGQCPQAQRSLFIHFMILDCPPGFELSEAKQSCICDERLLPYTKICIIDNETLLRDGDFWVGYDNTSTVKGLILSSHCPFDYCVSKPMFIRVDDSNKQCQHGRDGLLCGKCREGFSIVFGSSLCVHCTNNHILLLLAFAFAGIALVFFLFVLKLTVAVGTINGLIFYANIVQVNYSTFFPSGGTNVPLNVYIAWLNLDFGIETCFYDGMDMYAKTWLQFVFPIYVWALVGAVILVSRFSSGRIARMFGNNPLAVLATLFLLSYAKLLRTIITALSITHLQYPNGSDAAVWPHDGNIEYLSGKHTPLFVVSVTFFLLLFLPYTLLLLLGQWLQKRSWFNSHRIKHFLDAYYAPYVDKHRYWTGLLLLVRCILFLNFAIFGNTSVTLLAISSVVIGLLTIVTLQTEILYVNWYIWLLEASFLLNLGILSVATYYTNLTGGNQSAVTFISVGISFATFVGIILYHIFLQIRGTKVWKIVTRQHLRCGPHSINSNDDEVIPAVVAPSSTFVSIREPLLEPLQNY